MDSSPLIIVSNRGPLQFDRDENGERTVRRGGGGLVTALLSSHGPLQSLSGMFSALGNIGPCYISVQEMIDINPFVKITYIFGMLAGRLEILPVLLLFSRRAWQ